MRGEVVVAVVLSHHRLGVDAGLPRVVVVQQLGDDARATAGRIYRQPIMRGIHNAVAHCHHTVLVQAWEVGVDPRRGHAVGWVRTRDDVRVRVCRHQRGAADRGNTDDVVFEVDSIRSRPCVRATRLREEQRVADKAAQDVVLDGGQPLQVLGRRVVVIRGEDVEQVPRVKVVEEGVHTAVAPVPRSRGGRVLRDIMEQGACDHKGVANIRRHLRILERVVVDHIRDDAARDVERCVRTAADLEAIIDRQVVGEDQRDTRDVGRALHRSQPGGEPQGLEQVELRTRCSRQRAVELHTTHEVVARRLDRGDVGHRDGDAFFDEQVIRRLGRDGLLVPRRDPCEGV